MTPMSTSGTTVPVASIICPAFNEESGIESAIRRLRVCLDGLPVSAEVLIINDGSTDGTVAAATRAVGGDRRFRILSHKTNFGRGRAMRTGFQEARGEILITTEADLSWGEGVIGAMIDALQRDARLDAVFASPHLTGGGYRNVPWHRIMLSRFGNRILRALYPSPISMTTGMTRAYRVGAIRGQSFMRDGKELHLEIAHRLMSLGYNIGEVPAILSWPADVAAKNSRGKRTDWRKVRKLIVSHLAFGFFQGISRIIGPVIVLLTIAIVVFGAWAVRNALIGAPSIYLVTLVGVQLILWATLVVGYFILTHVFHIQSELWRLQSGLASDPAAVARDSRSYYHEQPLPTQAEG